MIRRSIIQFLILFIDIFFEYHYFVLNFILILCHLQLTGCEDRISLLYDYIISGFRCYSMKFINDYIMLELMYYKRNSFIKVSVITNANQYYAMTCRNRNVFQKVLGSISRQNIVTNNTSSIFLQPKVSFRFCNVNFAYMW